MQYFGFMRRNPNDQPDADYTGYDFWLTKLNQFNGNFVSADMVKGFITSAEHRQRFGNQETSADPTQLVWVWIRRPFPGRYYAIR